MYRGKSFHGDDKENNDFVEGRGCELLVWDDNLMTVPSVPPSSPEILGGAVIQTQVIFLHSTILFYFFYHRSQHWRTEIQKFYFICINNRIAIFRIRRTGWSAWNVYQGVANQPLRSQQDGNSDEWWWGWWWSQLWIMVKMMLAIGIIMMKTIIRKMVMTEGNILQITWLDADKMPISSGIQVEIYEIYSGENVWYIFRWKYMKYIRVKLKMYLKFWKKLETKHLFESRP